MTVGLNIPNFPGHFKIFFRYFLKYLSLTPIIKLQPETLDIVAHLPNFLMSVQGVNVTF